MSDAVSRPPLQPIQAAASSDEVNPALIAQIANALTSATAAQPPKNVQSRAAAKPATSKRSGGSTRGYSWTNEEENKLLELRLKEVNRKKENAQQTEGQHGHKAGNMQTEGLSLCHKTAATCCTCNQTCLVS